MKKVDIGKEAILRAAAALTARDEFGVVAFDECAHWVVKTRPLGGVTDLQGAASTASPRRPDEHLRGPRPGRRSRSRTPPRPGATSSCSPTAGPAAASTTRSSSDMKAAGITLSTVGAGGGANPFLAAARPAGRRPLLRRREPGVDPRHLPQGDAAGLRPADRRGEVLPDPDLVVADPPGHRRRASRAARLQRDDRQARRADRARDGARRPAPRPVAVRPRPLGGLDVGLDRPLGEELDRLERLHRRSSARWSAGRSRARRAAASRRRSRPRRADVPARRERQRGRLAARLLQDAGARRRSRPRRRRPWT